VREGHPKGRLLCEGAEEETLVWIRLSLDFKFCLRLLDFIWNFLTWC
jgi:hypothetical protein